MYSYFKKYRKAAGAAVRKVAASSPTAHAEHCSFGSGGVSLPPPLRPCPGFEDQLIEEEELSPEWMRRRERTHRKKPIPEFGAANLLDLPLRLKLPAIPGSSNVHCTANTCEKQMIEKQVNRLYETKRSHENCECARFQEWLLREKRRTPYQEPLIQNRYVDTTSRKLNKVEQPTDKWNLLQMKEKERHQLCFGGNILHKQFEEKLALRERKNAYHSQKMQRNDLRREEADRDIFKNKAQDESGSILHCKTCLKIPNKMSSNLILPRHNAQRKTTKQKKDNIQNDKEIIKRSHPLNNKGIKSTSHQYPGVSTKTENIRRQCVQHFLKQKMKNTDLNGKKTKKSSLNFCRSVPAGDSSVKQQKDQNHCQEKREEINSSPKPTTSFLQTLLNMTTSSYSEEDLSSCSSDDDDDSRSVPSAKVTED